MRKYALIREYENDVKKVMLYNSSNGVYVFLYNVVDDVPSFADLFFDTIEEAEGVCFAEYRITDLDWIMVSDPMEFCQHDLIAPVRVKGRDTGRLQWGEFEKFIDGNWVEYQICNK